MSINDEVPPSIRVRLEQLVRDAAGLDDFDLDERLAFMVASRDVAAAHGRARRAAAWNEAVTMLSDVRANRANVLREIEELTGPPRPNAVGLELPGDAS